jgi:hypothetical protein
VTTQNTGKYDSIGDKKEKGLCLLSPHIEEFRKMAIPIIWCYMQLPGADPGFQVEP